jgi:hypothetical protein
VDFQFAAIAGTGIDLPYGNAAGKFLVDVAFNLYTQIFQFIVLGHFTLLGDNTCCDNFFKKSQHTASYKSLPE